MNNVETSIASKLIDHKCTLPVQLKVNHSK